MPATEKTSAKNSNGDRPATPGESSIARSPALLRGAVAGLLVAACGVGLLVGPDRSAGQGVAWWENLPALNGDPHLSVSAASMKRGGSAFGKPAGVVLVSGSAEKLYRDFLSIDYHIDGVRSGASHVPRVFVSSIPHDVREIKSVEIRKALFIKTMLPLVLSMNEEIRADHERLRGLFASKGPLTDESRAWLARQYDAYGVEPGDREELLRRVDIIPPSMVLAQAAEESGWGTSRFAVEGRALFGQRTYGKAAGLVPREASDGGFRVRAFDRLLDGVRSYARNLNTHPAYSQFRERRAAMRAARKDGKLSPMPLIDTLVRYSERGADYVASLKAIIRVNDFRAFDDARLSNTAKRAKTLAGI